MQLAGTDLRILRVFDAVVRHGGFAAAQAELNISQPTISNHITTLEQRLGVSLCQRGRSGFQLTEKGEMVFAATQRLLRALEDFSEEVGVLKGHLAGQLRIGLVDCTATDSSSRLHDAIGRFLARPNDVTLHLHQEIPQVLQEKVLKGEYHLGIGSFPHKIKGLEYTPLYREEHGLYCGRGHSFFDIAEPELDMARLRDAPVVSRGYWRDEHRKTLGFDNVAAVAHQITLVTNTDAYPEAPASWKALWDPANEDRLGLLALVTNSFLLEITATTWFDGTAILDTEEGILKVMDKLAEVRPNVRLWYRDEGQFQQALETGEIPMGQYYHDVAGLAAADGKPVRSTFPAEGGVLDSGSWSVSKASKRIDEAQVFIDYMCRPSIQSKLSRFVGTAPTIRRELTDLTAEEFAAVASDIAPILPRYDLYNTRGDWLNQKWAELITS